MRTFKDFLVMEDKNNVTKKINSYITKIDSLPNAKLSSELKQIRKNFAEVLKNMNMFNDSDFSEFLKANNTKLMLQASNNLLKILNKNISENEKKEAELIQKYKEYVKRKQNMYWDDLTEKWIEPKDIKQSDLAKNGGSVYKRTQPYVSLDTWLKADGNERVANDLESWQSFSAYE